MPIQQMFLGATPASAGPGYGINFDGNDNINLGSTADLNPGNGDFTLEFWLKPTSWTDGNWNTIWHNYVVDGLYLGKDSSENFVIRSSNNTSYVEHWEHPPTAKWTHVAAVRTGGNLYLFYNGTIQKIVSNSFSFVTAATFIASTGGPGETYTGRISNMRFVKGTGLYTSTFTPPSSALTNVTNTKLLCCDSSSVTSATVSPGTISTWGDPAVDDGPFPFDPAGYSVSFNGTSGSAGGYLTIAGSTGLTMGTGDFTIECWVNKRAQTHKGIWQISGNSSGLETNEYGQTIALGYQNGVWQIYGGDGYQNSSSYNITAHQWYHAAYVRNGSTSKLYINGTEQISRSDTINYSGTYMAIGGYYNTSYLHNGNVSNLRITKGQALYTSNFTSTTDPLTTTSQGATASNVKLLCCNTNTRTGSTVTPGTITANGDNSAQYKNLCATSDSPFS